MDCVRLRLVRRKISMSPFLSKTATTATQHTRAGVHTCALRHLSRGSRRRRGDPRATRGPVTEWWTLSWGPETHSAVDSAGRRTVGRSPNFSQSREHLHAQHRTPHATPAARGTDLLSRLGVLGPLGGLLIRSGTQDGIWSSIWLAYLRVSLVSSSYLREKSFGFS